MERVKGQNMTKRIISLAVVAMMLVAIAIIPASAAIVDDKPLLPQYEVCGECGGRVDVTYGSWYVHDTSYVQCTHGYSVYDTLKTYYRAVTKNCRSCTNDYTYNQTKVEIICNG